MNASHFIYPLIHRWVFKTLSPAPVNSAGTNTYVQVFLCWMWSFFKALQEIWMFSKVCKLEDRKDLIESWEESVFREWAELPWLYVGKSVLCGGWLALYLGKCLMNTWWWREPRNFGWVLVMFNMWLIQISHGADTYEAFNIAKMIKTGCLALMVHIWVEDVVMWLRHFSEMQWFLGEVKRRNHSRVQLSNGSGEYWWTQRWNQWRSIIL